MKSIRIITMALLCMGFFSCEKRHIDDNMYPSSVYIINNGLQTEDLYDVEGKTHTFAINTHCSGFYGGDPNVRLVYNQTGVLDSYNEQNGTSYELLPENCYKLDSRHKVMDDNKVAFFVTFDCDKIAALSQKSDYSDIENYVIPYTLVSETEGVSNALVEDIDNIFIKITMNPMSFRLVAPKVKEVTSDDEYYYFSYKLQTVVPNKWESTYDVKFDFDILNESDYIITSSADKFTAGVSEVTFDVKVLRSSIDEYLRLIYDFKAVVTRTEGGFAIAGDTEAKFSFEPYPLYDRNKIDRLAKDRWPDNVTNSYPYGNNNCGPYDVLDGDFKTFWEPAWSAASKGDWTTASTTLPYWLIFDFPEEVEFVGYCFYQREGKTNQLKGGYVEYSDDRTNWVKAGDFEFANGSNGPHYFVHEPAKGKYMRLTLTSSYSGNTVSIAEMNIYVRN